MTLPYERTRAVLSTKDFLCDLINPKKTPRISREIRQRASACLRHFPTSFEMEIISEREDKTQSGSYKIFGSNECIYGKSES